MFVRFFFLISQNISADQKGAKVNYNCYIDDLRPFTNGILFR